MQTIKFLFLFVKLFLFAFVLAALLYAAIGGVFLLFGFWSWSMLIGGALGCGTGTGLMIGITQAIEGIRE